MSLDLSVLDGAPVEPSSGAPLELPIDAIEEDPDQPRIEFDQETLAELAATIRDRGVRQPVSVRPHPDDPARWVLNFGSRRLRASALAGRRTVPAFVDLSTDSYDQIIENEQRQNLQPLELALFVQRRMRAGDTAAEISRRLGKSRSYITFVGALIDAPDSVMELYRSGRCRGITELYEVRRLRECDPRAVDEWLSTAAEVTRTELQRLKERLTGCGTAEESMPLLVQHPTPSREPDARAVAPVPRVASKSVPELLQSPLEQHTAAQHAQSPRPKLLLLAQYRDEEVVVDLDVVPVQIGHVFVRQREQSQVIPVDVTFLSQLRIVRALA